MTLLSIMLGGAVGAGLRYGLSLILNPPMGMGMPWGTLTANLVGCLLLGWLSGHLSNAPEAVRLGVLVGVLGGFTTFSSFGLETIRLLQAGEWLTALTYALVSNGFGLIAVILGLKIAG